MIQDRCDFALEPATGGGFNRESEILYLYTDPFFIQITQLIQMSPKLIHIQWTRVIKSMNSAPKSNIVAINTVRQRKVRHAMAIRAVDKKPENRDASDWASLMLDIAERRDKAAFQGIFDYYAPRVKSFIMRGGIPEITAEEVAQETLLTVWRKADKYNPALASASTWIFTIARNKKIDRLRKDSRPLPDANDPTFAGPAVETPETTAWHSINAKKIHSALAQLPEDQRKVLTLAFIEENPHVAVSEMLGIPLGTVKSRIRLGLEKLRTLLAEQRGDFS